MSRDLLHRQRHFFRTPSFGEDKAIALMNRKAPSQIGQGKSALPISTIGRANESEKRLVLGDWQKLAFTEHPTGGREVTREHSNFTDVRLSHKIGSVGAWEYSLQSDAKGQCQEGLHIGVSLTPADIPD